MPVLSKPPVIPDAARTRTKAGFSRRVIILSCVCFFCAALFVDPPPLGLAGNAASTANASGPSEGGQISANAPAARSADSSASIPTIWPVKGAVTSGFGWRASPFGDGNELHQGVDIDNAMGAPVVASADGRVVQSGWAGDYGNMVQIDHGNGLSTIYGHNSQLLVSVGQTVKKGQVIAYVGSTGKSTGPHVHYEIRENGTAVPPWKYLVKY